MDNKIYNVNYVHRWHSNGSPMAEPGCVVLQGVHPLVWASCPPAKTVGYYAVTAWQTVEAAEQSAVAMVLQAQRVLSFETLATMIEGCERRLGWYGPEGLEANTAWAAHEAFNLNTLRQYKIGW